MRARFVADISKRFPTEDKGELEWILNTAITRDRAARTLNLSQALYTADLITKFGSYFERSRSRHFDSHRGLESFVDSSWATKFSCSGGMFFYHGCLFHWFSKMQRSVTLSSAEAEFFGAMLAAKELIFIRELLIELGIPVDAPSVIKCDSKSAVGMAFDPVAFKKTKHILRAAEFLRDLVAREVVSVEHLPGAVMLADILTKAASRAVFVELIKQLDTFA